MNIFSFFSKRRDNEVFVALKYGMPRSDNRYDINKWLDNMPDEVIKRIHHKLIKLGILVSPFDSIMQSRVLISWFAEHRADHGSFDSSMFKAIRKSLIEYEETL